MDSGPVSSPQDDADPVAVSVLKAQIAQARRELSDLNQSLQQQREREKLLLGELQHRVRNMLAVTRSIFVRTVATGRSLEGVANHFTGRLDVLARYQLTHAHDPGGSADFETMVRDELQSAAAAADPRVHIEGPEIRLAHEAAQLMGLAIHELFTNSIKFGVLSTSAERARLAIRWAVADERLEIEWTETGVAILAEAPISSGFGRIFIEEALPYQLRATSVFELAPGKLICRISLPLGQPHQSTMSWR
jgi:two-component sensor histidine kinase